jgi:hypothetical protein
VTVGIDRRTVDLTRQSGRAVDLARAGVTGFTGREVTQTCRIARIAITTFWRALTTRDALAAETLQSPIAITVATARITDPTASAGTPSESDEHHQRRE